MKERANYIVQRTLDNHYTGLELLFTCPSCGHTTKNLKDVVHHIVFSHTSPGRTKSTKAVNKITAGMQKSLILGESDEIGFVPMRVRVDHAADFRVVRNPKELHEFLDSEAYRLPTVTLLAVWNAVSKVIFLAMFFAAVIANLLAGIRGDFGVYIATVLFSIAYAAVFAVTDKFGIVMEYPFSGDSMKAVSVLSGIAYLVGFAGTHWV